MTKKSETTIYKSAFPSRLRTLLSETDTSQQELGTILGVQRQTVNMYVNGQIRPDIDALSIIAQHFNITTDWLLGLTNSRALVPIATDELGLSESVVKIIKDYNSSKEDPEDSVLNEFFKHVDFEELLDTFDEALRSCREALDAADAGHSETEGVDAAVDAAKSLDGTRWTVTTKEHRAERLFFQAQRLFNQISSDICEIDAVHDLIEYSA